MRATERATEAVRPRWPEGRRSCVVLAFDLDGPTGNAMLDGSIWRNPSYFTLGAYGPWRALGRILDVLGERGVRATFFLPAWVIENWPAQCREIVRGGHEVAYHGYRHEAFWTLTPERQREVMEISTQLFERHLGVRPVGFRTPSGDWTAETAGILAGFGVRYSSSMRGDDRPYVLDAKSGLIEIPARWELDDYASLAYQRKPDFPAGLDRIASYETTLDNWRREFDGSHEEGLCMTTLFHPKVSGKPGRIGMIEGFVDHMLATRDVWFATGSEVADWWNSSEQART